MHSILEIAGYFLIFVGFSVSLVMALINTHDMIKEDMEDSFIIGSIIWALIGAFGFLLLFIAN